MKATSVNEDWADCIPFNSDDDRTCGEIITELRAKEDNTQ